MKRGIWRSIGGVVCGLVAAVAGIALSAPGAQAASASCFSGEGYGLSMFEAGPGEANRVVAASRGGVTQQALKARGTNDVGNPISFDNICSSPDAEFHAATISLGDGKDVGRADGKGAETLGGQSGYKAVHRSIVVTIIGGSGRDMLVGHKGDGTLKGDAGRDRIKDLGGRDLIDGGPGPDKIKAKDGAPDLIVCDRRDTVRADPSDTTRGC